MKYELIHLKDRFPVLGNNGCDPTLEIFLPYNMTEMGRQDQKRPCILVCPGGGYAGCSQREAEPIALHFLPEGFNAFILTYSVAPHRFPTQLREVAAAIELIHHNADAWNCDPERIAIIGFSAGAHLAAHYSTCFDCSEVREVFPCSHPVQASILSYPVITADPAHAHMGSIINLSGHDPITTEDIEKFSCERHVTDHTPPAFLWHTAADNGVPVMNSLLYAGALSAHNIPFELRVYPYGGHGLATVDEQTNNGLTPEVTHAAEWLTAVKKWLKITL